MASELVAATLAAGLVVTVAVSLASSRVSTSLISLFYTSLILGVAFTAFGDALAGLLTMVTFAGAVTVLLLAVILITGESNLGIGASRPALALAVVTASVAAVSLTGVLAPGGDSGTSDLSLTVLGFAWTYRPWDLLVLVVALSSAMVGVTNFLGGGD